MKTLILLYPITFPISQFPPSIFFFRFPSLSRENAKFLHFSHSKSFYIKPPRYPLVRIGSSSCNSISYGGWDDDGDLGESDFLISTGIDNNKYVFVFLLGILCAFAISRVRVSTIIVFPASVLIFAVGFSFGFFRGGSLSVNSGKKRVKEETLKVYSERLRSLVDFFDGFDVKVSDLKSDIQRAIDSKEIELVDLEGYVSVIESIQRSVLSSRNAVESIGNFSDEVVENPRSSGRKKKEIGELGSELLQFVGGLFGEKLFESKSNNKVKDKGNVKQEVVANERIQGNKKGSANDRIEENRSIRDMEEVVLNANDKRKRSSVFSEGLRNESALNWDSERRIRIIAEDVKMNSANMRGNGKGYDGVRRSSRLQYSDNQRVSWKTNQDNETERWNSYDNTRESMDLNFSFERTETEASFVEEQLKQSSEVYRSSYGSKINEDETYRSQVEAEGLYDDSRMTDDESMMEKDVVSPFTSMVSDDLVFDKYLTESNNLLKQAKECIRGKHDEDHAEIILYKSAKLLSKAVALKPMSLLAVGLLGNTYLLHGELKLKISRELRTRLSRRDLDNRGRSFKILDEEITNKDKVASALVDVCEECEELLVEAGRKYRLALSIDGNDVRALYNWGLALSFRAQLLADIGPEAAFDADKVFLAAIDKFDAMMSKGNQYAPDALFRWGAVLQQRSRLRPRNSREKVKLLMQAKRLYEDALGMDSSNLQVREALLSCVGEINHRLL
ncbi:hypothetical protein M5689_008783 [Euphorbia peplus]|nr:hypothetical protein M5689_008783 [Euphorbia peplus]